MDNVILPIDKIVKNDLTINEYLVLYNVANNNSLTGLIEHRLEALDSLEKKGFIKMTKLGLFLREKASVFFVINEDLFSEWIKTYPTRVARRHGGNRALSPVSKNTMLGKKLEEKWKRIFKRDIDKQRLAIRVLQLQIKDMERSGDLEYMVEATRWLNEGYHEKYSYLIEQDKGDNLYESEDYL